MKVPQFLLTIVLAVTACTQRPAVSFELYDNGAVISPDKPDLIYIVSTNVMEAKDVEGRPSYIAELNDTDRMYYDKEFAFVERKISQGDFNLIAPYYHQFTFSGIELEEEEFNAVYQEVAEEICDFFDWYMAEVNDGRDFVLAGFSQGAMLLRDILSHMDEQVYSHMVAAYMMGYRLSEEDLGDPHINAAEGPTDTQVAISFNTTASEEGIWQFVSEGAATCMNPVSWSTGPGPAEFSYDGDKGTVSIDMERQVLMVDINPEKYRKWMQDSPIYSSMHPDNRHHWDLLFYTQQIHDNALLRVKKHGNT